MPHGSHSYQTASDTDMAKMCAYISSLHELPNYVYVLHCCAQCPFIDLPSESLYQHNSTTCPTISVHVYNLVSNFTVHGRHALTQKTYF